MFSSVACCGSGKVCGGIPGRPGPNTQACGDCASFKAGHCRGRDPSVPIQVSCGVLLLGLIVVGASVFS